MQQRCDGDATAATGHLRGLRLQQVVLVAQRLQLPHVLLHRHDLPQPSTRLRTPAAHGSHIYTQYNIISYIYNCLSIRLPIYRCPATLGTPSGAEQRARDAAGPMGAPQCVGRQRLARLRTGERRRPANAAAPPRR